MSTDNMAAVVECCVCGVEAAGPRTIDLYGYFYRRREIARAAPVRPPFTPNDTDTLIRTIEGEIYEIHSLLGTFEHQVPQNTVFIERKAECNLNT